MALEVSVPIPHTSLFIEKGYVKIQAFRFDCPAECFLKVRAYESKERADTDEKDFIVEEVKTIVLSDFGEKGDISMAKIYEILKTREEYADAVDVL